MENEFWLTRWHNQEIGFHQGQYNHNLVKYWPGMGLETDTQVLVPLCGKSLDMVYLAAQGHRVLGVELSETAVSEFFAEQQLAPTVSQRGAFRCYQSGPYTLLAGDFFGLRAEHLSQCQAVYDRAALIALPEPMRQAYCRLLAKLLPDGCKTLLLTLEYPEGQTQPPPFSVSVAEVETLFPAPCQVQHLGSSTEQLRGASASEHGFYLRYATG
ncbi:MAG: thiopurine S-methyltransferase [Cellvibrionaceae bacterium]|nr:thiopurine S-methyltransferase [Cellvibrionaceae bacterium]